jgi:hypothetical protein
VFRERQPGIYSSWRICQAQVNGFSNNSYRGYQTLEEVVEEFNQFLADEAMGYQGMAVQALPTQGMALQALPVQGMPAHAMPLQAMVVEAMPHHGRHRFRDFIILVLMVVIARLLFLV